MSEKRVVGPHNGYQIRVVSIFDIEKLAKEMKNWCKFQRYDYMERKHEYKDTDTGSDVKLMWHGDREVDDYVQFNIVVEFHAKHVNKVKVDGKLRDSGDIKVNISVWLILDYKDTWDKDRFTKLLGKLYNRYFMKKKIDTLYKPKLREEVTELIDKIKEVLELYR